jgi:hypothetical protein
LTLSGYYFAKTRENLKYESALDFYR